MIQELIDLILHVDDRLKETVQEYGGWTYTVLFAIVFCETGLVVTPILPGDSLLFAAGAIAADGSLNVWVVCGLLFVAAVLGDAVNYSIGKMLGPRVLDRDGRFLKRKYLVYTQSFFETYGGKAIIIARFVPIARTFAPFMAGVGSMNYWRFASYNFVGGLIWVTLLVAAGYFFGRIPFVEKNFELVIFAIIGISLMPPIFEWWRSRQRPAS